MKQSGIGPIRVGSITNTVAALAIAVLALMNLSWLVVIWFPGAYGDFGFTTGQAGGPVAGTTISVVVPGSPADEAGIKPGDTVDRPVALHDRLLVTGLTLPRPGERLTLSIAREGQHHIVSLQARPVPRLSLIDRLGDALLLTAPLVYVAVGLTLVLLRPSRMTWGFYLLAFALVAGNSLCNCWGYFSQTVPPIVLATIVPTLNGILISFGSVGFVVFCLRFPTNAPTGWRGALDNLAPYVAAALAAVGVLQSQSLIDFAPTLTDSLSHVSDAIVLAIISLGIAILLITYIGARGLERHRIKWVILGLVSMTIPVVAFFLSAEGRVNVSDRAFSVLNLFYIPLPLAIAYAVIHHRVTDVRFIISRSLAFAVTVGIVGLIVVGLDWLFSTRLPKSQFQSAAYFGAALLIGLSLNSGRQRISKAIDALFFRQWRRSQEQVDAIAGVIRRATSRADLYEPLTAGIRSAFSLTSVAFFERVEDGGFVRVAAAGWSVGTIWHILPGDPLITRAYNRVRAIDIDSLQWGASDMPSGFARPAVMVPMVAGRQVLAILLLGAHENGTALAQDELRLILRLVEDACPVFAMANTEVVRGGAGAVRVAGT